MSDAYENVVGGKLKLKGKAALDVKSGSGGIHKHKKKKHRPPGSDANLLSAAAGGGTQLSSSDHHPSHVEVGQDDQGEAGDDDAAKSTTAGAADGGGARWDDHLTPAERRYLQQKATIDNRTLAKTADKSHRDRIQDFNQYLANMSEHYDIPKVGPG